MVFYDFDWNNSDQMSELFWELMNRVRDLELKSETTDDCDLKADIDNLSKTFWGFVNSWLHITTAICARLEQATGVSLSDLLNDENVPKQS